MPVVAVPVPAARPPSLKSLQSMVTLLVAMMIAAPLVMAVFAS